MFQKRVNTFNGAGTARGEAGWMDPLQQADWTTRKKDPALDCIRKYGLRTASGFPALGNGMASN
ncbi:hypothetical protein DPV78_011956 [Talaromyces pinophilus]|nr:hypothetical protein DPV78_011956 [Talaromyces pinophilus]